MKTSNYYSGKIWRGVDYSPTWPTWSATPNTQTGDSDFANDAFQSLWSNKYLPAPTNDPSGPVKNSNYRDDLKTISDLGFNLIRLYNWNMARGTTSSSNTGLDHINFLNYAYSLGLKVVVPISDYFLGDNQYSWNNGSPDATYSFDSAPSGIQTDFTEFINSITDPSTNQIHEAVHSVSVGNEGDIGEGINGTSPSNFLARTIWWIVNLNKQINGSGDSPSIKLSATFSNADQGGSNGSWFSCLMNGVTANQNTPYGCALGSSFGFAVTGLSAIDSSYKDYYYNSVNISQVNVSDNSNNLAATLALYDSGASSWPGGTMNVPLLLMEVFAPNRGSSPAPYDQATAAVNQVGSIEKYLHDNKAGTASSTTWLFGYNYFEFNDEPELNKTVGLYGYIDTDDEESTGTTSLSYGSFPSITFPLYKLEANPGPDGTGTLPAAITKHFPALKEPAQVV
ncbi:hypothetical protein JMN32_06780 [Fulvivirga sp. 29W222]|uniref:Uncharacterized protein n=1 Tax=Fulvivirga marina TaxID=2494733 RepID=A0A937G011_9BACT|nr:hypothetical protein [Fulvivirga marina]MBL6446006.1 hypothetical protein [Fulvivirga marina]